MDRYPEPDVPPEIADMMRILADAGVMSPGLARDLAARIVHALGDRLLPPLLLKMPRWRAVTPKGTVKGVDESSARAMVRLYGGEVGYSYTALHDRGFEVLHPWGPDPAQIDRSSANPDPEQQKH